MYLSSTLEHKPSAHTINDFMYTIIMTVVLANYLELTAAKHTKILIW